MSTAADAALPQFRLYYSFPLYHPAPSIEGSASACSTMINSSFQSQLPGSRRSSSSQLIIPASSWNPTETRQNWGDYETSTQEGTYAPASTLVYQHHNQTATSITYSFQPPRTNSYARSPPTNIYNVSQTPSFTQRPHTPTPKSSSLPFLPHYHLHPPTLPPLEHNVPLPLDHSLETVDPRPYLQFLASKTSPPEMPLSPHPEPVTSIRIHQRPIPPRTVDDSEIVKTDSTQPGAFACLSTDSDFSAGMLDLGIKSCKSCGLISSMNSKADERRFSGRIATYYMFCTGSKPLA